MKSTIQRFLTRWSRGAASRVVSLASSFHELIGTEARGHTLEALIDELARVLHEAGEARELARRAGFPVADLPDFDTASVFWSRVVRAANDGRTLGGVGAIVEQAKTKLPGNRFFAAYRLTTSAITTCAPQHPLSL